MCVAASISNKSKEFPAVIAWQDLQLLQGSSSVSYRFSQFKLLAKILAKDVLPIPRGPVKI